MEAPPVARAPATGQQTNQQAPSPAQPAVAPRLQPSAASAGPNANPLNLFPPVCAVKLCFDLNVWTLSYYVNWYTLLETIHYPYILCLWHDCHERKCHRNFFHTIWITSII